MTAIREALRVCVCIVTFCAICVGFVMLYPLALIHDGIAWARWRAREGGDSIVH